jgi:hypothetical protein
MPDGLAAVTVPLAVEFVTDSAAPAVIADIMTIVNRWFERLSNWQYVVAAASLFLVLSLVVAGCFNLLFDGHVELTSAITSAVGFTVLFTSYFSWRRWR